MCRVLLLLAACGALLAAPARAGQAPLAASAPDVPITGADRVYASCQTSNAVSVIDPAAGKLLGVIPLGGQLPASLGAIYTGEALVHGLGFAPDGKTVAAVCVSSNAIVFIGAPQRRRQARGAAGGPRAAGAFGAVHAAARPPAACTPSCRPTLLPT